MKAQVGAFNQEKALVGAFSVIVQLVVEPMDRFAALVLFFSYFNVILLYYTVNVKMYSQKCGRTKEASLYYFVQSDYYGSGSASSNNFIQPL